MLLTGLLWVVSLTLFINPAPKFVDCKVVDVDLSFGRRTTLHGHSHKKGPKEPATSKRNDPLINNTTEIIEVGEPNAQAEAQPAAGFNSLSPQPQPQPSSGVDTGVTAGSPRPIEQGSISLQSARSKPVGTFQPAGVTDGRDRNVQLSNSTIPKKTLGIKKIPYTYKKRLPASESTPSADNLGTANSVDNNVGTLTNAGDQIGTSLSGGPNPLASTDKIADSNLRSSRPRTVVFSSPRKKGQSGTGAQMDSGPANGNFSSDSPSNLPLGSEGVIENGEDFETIYKPKSKTNLNGNVGTVQGDDKETGDTNENQQTRTSLPIGTENGENVLNINNEDQTVSGSAVKKAPQMINNQRTNIKYESNVVINNFYDGNTLIYSNKTNLPVNGNTTGVSEPATSTFPDGNGNLISMAKPSPSSLEAGINGANGSIINNFYNGDKLIYVNTTDLTDENAQDNRNTISTVGATDGNAADNGNTISTMGATEGNAADNGNIISTVAATDGNAADNGNLISPIGATDGNAAGNGNTISTMGATDGNAAGNGNIISTVGAVSPSTPEVVNDNTNNPVGIGGDGTDPGNNVAVENSAVEPNGSTAVGANA